MAASTANGADAAISPLTVPTGLRRRGIRQERHALACVEIARDGWTRRPFRQNAKPNTGDFHARRIRGHTRDQVVPPLMSSASKSTFSHEAPEPVVTRSARQARKAADRHRTAIHAISPFCGEGKQRIQHRRQRHDRGAGHSCTPSGRHDPWFRYDEGGGEMISMTSCEAACHFFTDADRASSHRRSSRSPISMVSPSSCPRGQEPRRASPIIFRRVASLVPRGKSTS